MNFALILRAGAKGTLVGEVGWVIFLNLGIGVWIRLWKVCSGCGQMIHHRLKQGVRRIGVTSGDITLLAKIRVQIVIELRVGPFVEIKQFVVASDNR